MAGTRARAMHTHVHEHVHVPRPASRRAAPRRPAPRRAARLRVACAVRQLVFDICKTYATHTSQVAWKNALEAVQHVLTELDVMQVRLPPCPPSLLALALAPAPLSSHCPCPIRLCSLPLPLSLCPFPSRYLSAVLSLTLAAARVQNVDYLPCSPCSKRRLFSSAQASSQG